MSNERTESEGEELIAEFLEEKNIDFKREVEISGLKGDYNKAYRIADFYLPQYNVYIEFLGLWNLENDRKSYQEKKRVYEENNIPCLYLYPDNLGALDWIFTRRLRNVLKKHNRKWGLFKYDFTIFQDKHLMGIIIGAILIYYIKDFAVKVLLIVFLMYYLYSSVKATFLK